MDDDRMSMSSDGSSDLYDPSNVPAATEADLTTRPHNTFTEKRSLEVDGDDSSEKKARTGSDASSSPAKHMPAMDRISSGLWQHIFSYLSPPSLGRVMQVSKAFKSCLDGSIPPHLDSGNGPMKTVDAESLWAQWRTMHVPNMPKPLQGLTERDMWKLIRGFRCEMCGKIDEAPRQSNTVDLWHGGPQMSTTRAIWPFGGRYCAECCFRSCEKDTKLLCTPVKAFMSALPYAFFTHDWHYVPTTVMKDAGSAPHGVHITKQFWQLHSEQILNEYEDVKKLGAPAAEEWSKGLAGLGKHTMDDAARWERWETKGGLSYVHSLLAPQPPTPPQQALPPNLRQSPPQAWATNGYGWPANAVPQFHQPQPVSMAQNPFSYYTSTAGHYPSQQTSPVSLGPSPFPQPTNSSTPHTQAPNSFAHNQSQVAQQSQAPQQRVERNSKDAQAAKAARRRAIEERAFSDIGILPNVLRHMESFQAAIQISAPLTDSAWEVLKPRLNGQRETAEQLEHEHTAQLLALQAQNDSQGKRNPYSKEAKDAQEREWEEALRPQREQLSIYADNHIRGEWRGGQTINNGNVARFAISVFHAVRKQFYSELEKQDSLAHAYSLQIRYDPPDGPFLRRLTLETMKWVHDHKIRPLTRDYGKEIFFCAGEGCEGNNKFYAFEGVIQHFGAKHTNSFSKGNVIVHWQSADWPEELPFFDPGSGPVRAHQGNGGFSRGATITPQIISSVFQPPSLTTSPYGQTPYSGHSHGPFAPPVGGMSGNQAIFQSGLTFPPSPQNSNQTYDKHDLSQFFKVSLNGLQSAPTNPAAEGVRAPPNNALQGGLSSVTQMPQAGSHPPSGTKPPLFDTDMPDFEAYQDQLKHIADTAKYAWNSTSAILGLPQSVRVFAVVHHTVSQFSNRFGVELSLETFTAALTNNPLLEPLKNADGLVCHFCSLQSASEIPGSLPGLMTGEVDLTRLISHFKTVHIDGRGPLSLPHLRNSWAKEMIALPADSVISGLISAAGMTDEKLFLLGDALPDLLPRKFPRQKDISSKPKGKNNRRSNRTLSGSKGSGPDDRQDGGHDADYTPWEPNKPEDEEPGYSGFFRRSQSPTVPGGRRRTPKLYDDESEQYDPAKPALISDPGGKGHKRAHGRLHAASDHPRAADRDRERKRSGANTDLASLIMSASEEAHRAAEEENRRRGIIPQASATGQPTYPPSGTISQGRPLPPQSRPGSADRILYATSPGFDGERRAIHRSPYSPGDRGNSTRMLNQYAAQQNSYVERPSPPIGRPIRDYQEISYDTVDPIPRARSSRFARYDDQRERMLRDRSRSPVRFDENAYPSGAYREPARQRDYADAPVEIRPGASSIPVDYQYPSEPEPIYVDEFGRPVRFVRLRDEPRARYVAQHPGESRVEYVERMPMYDDRPQLYYGDDRAPGARAAPDTRYEPRSLPLSSLSRDARYVE